MIPTYRSAYTNGILFNTTAISLSLQDGWQAYYERGWLWISKLPYCMSLYHNPAGTVKQVANLQQDLAYLLTDIGLSVTLQ